MHRKCLAATWCSKSAKPLGPTKDDVQIAADLAAYFSHARGNNAVPVVSTETRHLQRIPGAGSGVLRFRESRVLWGHPDAVAPLLRSKGP